ncbi:MAG: gliding motility-associated C-terminal domain-containing protein [Saprospiraceae bacterium]|nr:gliding motility-associated C-terminal domain-containing protein [Saprospiraceae bacterium]
MDFFPYLCSEDSVVLSAVAFGGADPYTFAWSTGETTQSIIAQNPGTYSLTITGVNGCTRSITVSPPGIIQPYAYPSANGTNCGDSHTIEVIFPQGDIPPGLTYDWSTGETSPEIIVTQTGTYTVTLTDQYGCTQVLTDSVEIGEPPLAEIVATGNLCTGGSVTLSNLYGPYENYQWTNQDFSEFWYEPTLVITEPGVYFLTVTEPGVGCWASAEIIITGGSGDIPPPELSGPTAICEGQEAMIEVINAADYTSFNWSTGDVGPSIMVVSPGTYTVTVEGSTGCTAIETFTVGNNSGITLSSLITPNTSCNNANGAIDLTVSPADTYTFSWSNGSASEDLDLLTEGTYYVTVTASDGCTATAAAIVGANILLPTLSGSSQPNTSCATPNGSVQITPGPPGIFNFEWSNGASTEDLDGLTGGSYTVTITAETGCTTTGAYTVNNNAVSPTLNQTTTPASCGQANGAINLTVTPAGGGPFMFVWSNGDTTEDLDNLLAGLYTVTATGANGCSATAIVDVANADQTPAVSGIITQNTACDVPNGAINTTPTPAGSYTYLWSNNETTEDIVDLIGGTYTVTISAGGTCTVSSSFVVNNHPQLPVISMNVVPATCGQDNGSILLTITPPGIGPFLFLWSNGATTEDLNGVLPGDYQVTVTANNGCTQTQDAMVLNDNIPFSATIAATPNTSCDVPNGAVDVSISIPGTYTYVWSNGATTEDLANIAAGDYSVTVTGDNGCTATTAATVLNNSAPFSANPAAIPNTSCDVPNGAVDVSISIPGTYTYVWSNGATTQDIFDLPAGAYTVTVTNQDGCTTTANESVLDDLVYFSANPSATPNTSCDVPNGAVDVSISLPGTYTYVWSNGATTEDLVNIAPGDYSVTVTGDNGCTATAAAIINSDVVMPQFLIQAQDAFCGQNNGAIQLQILAGTPPFAFLWENGSSQQNRSDVEAGHYSATITDANGCTASGSAEVININNVFSVSGQTTNNHSCVGANGAIVLEISQPGNYSFLWSNGAQTQHLSGLSEGAYAVTVSDQLHCTATAAFQLQDQAEPPVILADVMPGDCMDPSGAILVEWVQGGTPPILFSIDGGISFTENALFENLAPGNYQVLVHDAGGCVNSQTIQLVAPQIPQILPLPDISLVLGATQTLNVQLQAGFPVSLIDSVIWSPETGLIFDGNTITDRLNPVLSGTSTQTYTVTLRTENGCETSAVFRLQVDEQRGLYAPNVIWPESPDGVNNAFTLFTRPGSLKEILILKIYDRWGDELFSREHFPADDLNLGWNGDFRGQPMNPAVFVWWAEVEWKDGKRSIYKGDVTVVR